MRPTAKLRGKFLSRPMTNPNNKGLTADLLRQQVEYDQQTGVFRRRRSFGPNVRVGQVAGSLKKDGYVRFSVLGKTHMAHRLAWLYVMGQWPINEIDHINSIRADNRFSNLRDVPKKTNAENRRTASRLKVSGLALGVAFNKAMQKFQASITTGGKPRYLGLYDTEEQAHQAYVAVKRQLHEGCTL